MYRIFTTQMDLNPTELQRCHTVYVNVHEMLADRGYAIDKRNLTITLQTFRERFGQHPNRRQMTLVYESAADDENDDRGPLLVVFASDPKVGVGPVRQLVQDMCETDAQDAILIVQKGVTPTAGAALRQLAPQLRVQVFLEQEMLCMSSIMHHELQPHFTVLKKADKEALLTKYKCKDSQLPRMLVTDTVARYYGLRRGHVLKIVRPSETAGRYTTYRCVG